MAETLAGSISLSIDPYLAAIRQVEAQTRSLMEQTARHFTQVDAASQRLSQGVSALGSAHRTQGASSKEAADYILQYGQGAQRADQTTRQAATSVEALTATQRTQSTSAQQAAQQTRAFGQSTQQAGELARSGGDQARRAGDSAEEAGRKFEGARRPVKGFFDEFLNIGAIRNFVTLLGTVQLVKFAADTVNVAATLQRLELGLTATLGGVRQAQAEIANLSTLSDRLGVAFFKTTDSVRGFIQSATDAGLSTEKLRQVYTGVITAGTATGRTTEQMGRAFTALQQILDKQQVMGEELRGQLSEALPGSMRRFAEAAGFTGTNAVAALSSAMEDGKIKGQAAMQAVVNFGAVLTRDFAPAATKAAEGATAAFARFQNAITGLQKAMGESGLLTTITNMANSLTTIIKAMTDTHTATTRLTASQEGVRVFFEIVKTAATGALGIVQGVAAALGAVARAIPGAAQAAQAAQAGTPEGVTKQRSGVQDRMIQIQDEITRRETDVAAAQTAGRPGVPAMQALIEQRRALLREEQAKFDALGKQVAELSKPVLGPETLVVPKGKETPEIITKLNDQLKSFNVNRITEIRAEIKLLQEALASGKLDPDQRIVSTQGLGERQKELQTLLAGGKSTVGEIKKQGEELEQAFKRMTGLRLPSEIDKDIAALSQHLKSAKLPSEIAGINEALLKLQQEKDAFKNFVPDIGNLREIQQVGQEIQQLQARLANPAKFNIDASQVPFVEQQLSELQDKYSELTQTLEQRITNRGLADFGEAMGGLAEGIDEGKKAAMEFVEEHNAFAISAAQTPEALAKAYSDLLADMALVNDNLALSAKIGAEGATRIVATYAKERAEVLKGQEQEAANILKLDTIRNNSVAGRQQAFDAYIQRMKQLGTDEMEVQELIADETQRRLEEEAQAFQHFSERVQDFLGDTLFDVLTGKIKSTEEALESFRDTVLRVISQLAAKQITEGLLTSFGKIAGLFTGSGGTATSRGGSGATEILVGSGANAAQQFGQGAAGTIGGVPTSGVGSSLVSGAAVGLIAATASSGLFEGFGLRGKANSAVSGVVGGAAGGLITGLGIAAAGAAAGAAVGSVVPIVGTIIGAVVGGIVGALVGKDVEIPKLEFGRVAAPRFFAGPSGIRPNTDISLRPDVTDENAIGEDIQDVNRALKLKGDELFINVIESVNQLPKSFQGRVISPLNALTEEFELRIDNVRFANKNIWKNFEDYLTNDVPREFEAVFEEFINAVRAVAPVAKAVEGVLQELQDQQQRLISGIQAGQKSLQEALFTPANLFERRQTELQRMLTQFDTGDDQTRLRLAPKITELAQEVFGLAKNQDVLGQDLPALRALQTELLKILEETETATREIFVEQRDLAKEQLDILMRSLTALSTVQTAIDSSNTYLERMAVFFERSFSGSFASGGVVPSTGIAFVHAGETIFPAHVSSNASFPFVGSFQSGGIVPATGWGLLHGGETVVALPSATASSPPASSGLLVSPASGGFLASAPALTPPSSPLAQFPHEFARQDRSVPAWLDAMTGIRDMPFVGSYQSGGMIPETGLALVHQGERVLPAPSVFRDATAPVSHMTSSTNNVSGDTVTNHYAVNVEVHTAGAPVNAQRLAADVMREIENRSKLRQTKVATKGSR